MSWPAGGDEQTYRYGQAGRATRQPMAPRDARTEPDHVCPPDAADYTFRVYTESIYVVNNGIKSRCSRRARQRREGRVTPAGGFAMRQNAHGASKAAAVRETPDHKASDRTAEPATPRPRQRRPDRRC